MPEIEEIDDELELELEANPGEDDGASLDLESNPGDDGGLDLESNPGDDDGLLELEDNPGERPGGALRIGTLVLESNAAFGADGDDEDDDEDQWEIPFAMELPEAPNLDEIVDVRLLRKADERLGLVLDASNVIVALRDDTPAARSGGLFVGDTVLAVQGVACTAERRVAQLLRELPDAPTYVFTVKRALDASHSARALSEPVTEHGPLMTPEEAEAQRQREYEARMKIRDEVDALPDSHEAKAALKQQLAPQNLSETKYISSQKEADPAAKKMMNDLWCVAYSHMSLMSTCARMPIRHMLYVHLHALAAREPSTLPSATHRPAVRFPPARPSPWLVHPWAMCAGTARRAISSCAG